MVKRPEVVLLVDIVQKKRRKLPGTVGVDGGFYHLYGLFSAIIKSKIDSIVKLYIFTYIQEWAVFGLFN